MSRSEGPSGPTPLLQHPFVLPTLFVVGGWMLLLGGYIPGQGNRSESASAPPCCSWHHGHPHPYPEPSPSPTVIEAPSTPHPFRLTIEFPNGQVEGSSVVDTQPSPSGTPVPESVAVDPSTTRTAARLEEPVEPPPIPGPPPDFDPSILSPWFPESVPLSPSDAPRLGGKWAAEVPTARPIEELPESFEPSSIHHRFRRDTPNEAPADQSPASELESVPEQISPDLRSDDRAPEPPTVPEIHPEPLPELSTAPVILPEPIPDDVEEPMPAPAPPQPSDRPISASAVRLPKPSREPAPRGFKGLKGLFPGRRSQPDDLERPPVPIDRSEAIAEVFPPRSGPVVPSDILLKTDSLFQTTPAPEPPAPMPVEVLEEVPVIEPEPVNDVPRMSVPTPVPQPTTTQAPQPRTYRAPVRTLSLPLPRADEAILRARSETNPPSPWKESGIEDGTEGASDRSEVEGESPADSGQESRIGPE